MGLVRTWLLMAAMTALFGAIGMAIGGQQGMIIALGFALASNLFAYWNSDRIVLKMYRARPVDPYEQPGLYRIIQRLTDNAGIPMPSAYIIPSSQPNAFATGRNPENAAVAVTEGLLAMLNERELAGVIAHELAHVKNRDTLIMTVTATLAGAISALANFAFFFGGRNDRIGPIGSLLIMILAPMAAMLVQMAISRTREYEADRIGAEISEDPAALASALEKIQNTAARVDNHDAERNPATAHLFIINPLHMRAVDSLFATHPHTANRIERLMELAQKMGRKVARQPRHDYPAGPWG